ncbi:MAG: hypothetical protein IT204_23855 [Fimbriimonadaceae bacterium]|nr:hypothetical protein [Fimbriimonadaceae bacterium]
MGKQLRHALTGAIGLLALLPQAAADDQLDGDGVSESVEVRVMVAGYAEVTIEGPTLLLRVPRPGATATAQLSGTVRTNIPVSVQLSGSGDAGVPRITLSRVDGVPFARLAGEALTDTPFAWNAGLQVGADTASFGGSGTTCRIDDVPAGANPLAITGSLTTHADFALTAAAGTTNAAETLVVTVSG